MKQKVLLCFILSAFLVLPFFTKGQSVLICGAPYDANWNNDVQAKLLSTGQFATVDFVNTSIYTPTVAEMLMYDAVLNFTDIGVLDAFQYGNNLAAYIDQGGGVVNCVFTMATVPLGGAFVSGETYAVALYSGVQSQVPNLTLGNVVNANHPIMSGVTSFNGGSSSYHSSGNLFAVGTEIQAYWSNGEFFVATKENVGPLGVRRADLNFYPPSSDARSDFWDATTNGSLLLANALTWVMNLNIPGCTNPIACNYNPSATVDDGSCVLPNYYYADLDSDGFGAGISVALCTTQPGYVSNNTDCSDNNPAIFPGANEVCNGIDDDCDTQIDNGLGVLVSDITVTSWIWNYDWYCDGASVGSPSLIFYPDGTWFGESSTGFWSLCGDVFTLGFDNYATIYSGTYSNGIITGTMDDMMGSTGCFTITPITPIGCTDPNACNYNSSATVDDGSCVLPNYYYADLDSDGFGAGISVALCTNQPGFVSNSSDCDDLNSAVNPNAVEVCFNFMDDNCDSQIDENCAILGCTYSNACNYDSTANVDNGSCIFPTTVFYLDADADSFGSSDNSMLTCDSIAPAGYVVNNSDCDDLNSAVNPYAEEIAGNGIDEDCDGQIDNSVLEMEEFSYLIYPNPANNFIQVKLPISHMQKLYAVYNSLGEEVLKGQIAGNTLNIDLSELSEGAYFFRIEQEIKSFVIIR